MEYYDIISKRYNELHGQEQAIKLQLIKENLDIKPLDLMLDVGCGTSLSDFNCKVIGLDPSLEMLKQNPADIIQAKAEHIPFKDKTFDKVISVTSIHNFKDIKKGISEMKRVGKKDFAFSILKKTSHMERIRREIKNNFQIKKVLDGKKDWIYICNSKSF